MKILIFGGDGQIGHTLQRTLPPLGEIIALKKSDADLADLRNLHTLLEKQAPNVIVNAAAYTAVDKAEADPLQAQTINADAVRVMADYARDNNVLLVHYSTDYVFDGKKKNAYIEDDPTNPLNVYGKTKRAGEEAIQQAGCHHLIFRTSWVYSPHGQNFIKTILRLATEREGLNIVADQFGSPTSAELIADMTARAIFAWRNGTLPDGLYHLTAAGETCWYELACYVIERAIIKGIKLKLDATNVHPVSSEEYPLPAPRPKNSRLNSEKLIHHLGIQMPGWEIHVERMLDQLIQLQRLEK